MEQLSEGMVEVSLSRETKSRIRAPWSKTLIVKVFGRSVGFNYLTFKINAMWNPKGKMDCVALGKDFFLIKFYDNEDYDKVLQGGPWFMGEHFLAIKPWEPYFKASKAKFTSIAVWVRLPELPIEFYDAMVLKEIGSALGPVLRIDSFTATSSKGSYARLCIQVDLDKPLKIGRLKQRVMYEGISSLCFCCGRIGHKKENCSNQILPKMVEAVKEDNTPASSNERKAEDTSNSNYGSWMIVTRCKNPVKNGWGRWPNQPARQGERVTKGNLAIPGGDVVQTTPLENVKSISMYSEKSTHNTVISEITVHPTVGMECGNDMEIWVPSLSSEKEMMATSGGNEQTSIV